MSDFGWDLPPGCSDADIDRAAEHLDERYCRCDRCYVRERCETCGAPLGSGTGCPACSLICDYCGAPGAVRVETETCACDRCLAEWDYDKRNREE